MSTASYVAVVTVRIRSGTIFVSMLFVRSGKFSGEHRCAKESHSEAASSLGLGCVGGIGAVPFDALILIHTSAELLLLLHLVIHWFQDRFLTWVHSFAYSLYVVCTCSRLAGDVCRLYAFSLVLQLCFAILIPMLFFQYGVVDVFPDDLGIDNSAVSSICLL